MNLDYVESNEHRMERNDDRANMMNEQEEQKSNMKCHVFYEKKNHIRTLHTQCSINVCLLTKAEEGSGERSGKEKQNQIACNPIKSVSRSK